MDAPYTMIIFGVLLLAFRYFSEQALLQVLCPYGVLLNIFSRFAGKHLTITPAECTNCRLCEDVCPYDAIIPSDPEPQRDLPDKLKKTVHSLFLFIPLFAAAGALFCIILLLPCQG